MIHTAKIKRILSMTNSLPRNINRIAMLRIDNPGLHITPVFIGKILWPFEPHGLQLIGATRCLHVGNNLANEPWAVVARRPASLHFSGPGVDHQGMRRGATTDDKQCGDSDKFHGNLLNHMLSMLAVT